MNLREQLGLWISSLRSRFLLFPSFPLINFILDFGFPFSSQCKHVDFCSWTKPRKQGANELRMALLKETDPSSRFLNVYSLWHPNYFLLAEWKGKICFLRWGNETFRFWKNLLTFGVNSCHWIYPLCTLSYKSIWVDLLQLATGGRSYRKTCQQAWEAFLMKLRFLAWEAWSVPLTMGTLHFIVTWYPNKSIN